MDQEELQNAKDYVFNLLSYRDRTYFELENRLSKKGYDQDIIEKVLNRLKELGYIDDYKFAVKWVKDRLKNKPRGKILIKKELIKKGINKDIIDKVTNKIIDNNIEIKQGSKLAVKWLSSHCQKDNSFKYKLRLKRYLNNKGYSLNIINEIIKKVNINIKEG